jgi:hypothetical protein
MACTASGADAITIAGASKADVNGVYKRKKAKSGQLLADKGTLMFELDTTHQLYASGGYWRLAHFGNSSQLYYTAKHGDAGGPPSNEVNWITAAGGTGHGPTNTTCSSGGSGGGSGGGSSGGSGGGSGGGSSGGGSGGGVGVGGGAAGSCQCAHASPCAACHTDKYYPPAAVELWQCDEKATHIRWTQLTVENSINGSDSHATAAAAAAAATPKGLLMTNGLCLEVSKATAATAAAPAPAPAGPMTQRVQMKHPHVPVLDAASVSAVRITVTGTNGIPEARINEVRLYDNEGIPPYSMRK